MSEIKTLMYKGKPLVRQGQFLFYGFPDEKYILFMNILESKKVGGVEIATKVLVQIQSTDNEVSFNDKIVKQCEKRNFYDAFEIGIIWLERELKK
ncbi:MAG: hypothetical protein CVU97_03135 [Firmicutes bacterium HGW-Firmicutes-21]|nr:MAG: hypothetical protein CVU97_03135 [Firmicutes bacterium HGW-Firmicutes-21]